MPRSMDENAELKEIELQVNQQETASAQGERKGARNWRHFLPRSKAVSLCRGCCAG